MKNIKPIFICYVPYKMTDKAKDKIKFTINNSLNGDYHHFVVSKNISDIEFELFSVYSNSVVISKDEAKKIIGRIKLEE